VHATIVVVAQKPFPSAVRFQRVPVGHLLQLLFDTISIRQSASYSNRFVLLPPYATAPVLFSLLLVCSNYFSMPLVTGWLHL
jgi:hypothetical protein